MEQEYILSSKRNLDNLLKKITKYKIVWNDFEVELAMKGLCIFHCIRQSNINNVLKDGEIKIKNLITEGEFTNSQSDYFQGFDNHLSMSVGSPWTEYGPYSFVFGLENLSSEALFFFKDPWQFHNKALERNFLIKEDFETFAKELLKRNLKFRNRNIITPKWLKGDLHNLAKYNFRNFEIKQPENLKIIDSVEFLTWTSFDSFLSSFVRIFWRWWILVGILLIILLDTWFY